MAWPNPFRRHTPNTRRCWNYEFELTEDHLSLEDSEPLKHRYDQLADAALDRLNAISPPASTPPPGQDNQNQSLPSDVKLPVPKRDLYQVLEENHASDPVLSELWQQENHVPEWVDWAQIARGQEVFYRYGSASVNGLAFQSLLGGLGAARVVEVLARTGGFGTKVARHRLYETTQHILQVTRSLESVQPGGEGWRSSIRVRLLHAAVRKRIMRLAAARPAYYDVGRNGIPVNDLDSIGTLASFSSTLIWIALPRQGIFLRQREIEDYLALWRYVGHLLGTPVDDFATPAKAKAIMESLLLNELHPSDTSRTLSRNLIEALSMVPPTYLSKEFLEANGRWLLGNELCDALGLGHPPLYYWGLVVGQCIFFMSICYAYRTFEHLDRFKVDRMRKALWRFIVESESGLKGQQAMFEFKYVPEDRKTTVYEASGRTGLVPKGVERRNLIVLGIFSVVLGASTFAGIKLVGAVFRLVRT